MHLLEQRPRPLIIAHRGASAHAPENTLSAFRLAVEQGADGIELDAKLSADAHVMVIHDSRVDRTTQGHGAVRELTLEQLKELDAGSFFDQSFKNEPIPTLDEVFAAVGQQTLINVELTNYASPRDDLVKRVAALVTQHKLQERVFFSSFYPVNLIRIRRLLPNTPVAILATGGFSGNTARGWIGRLSAPHIVHPYFSDVSEAYLAREHRRKRMVNTWTVDDPVEMRRLFKMGIDGIITDDPRLARQVLEEQ